MKSTKKISFPVQAAVLAILACALAPLAFPQGLTVRTGGASLSGTTNELTVVSGVLKIDGSPIGGSGTTTITTTNVYEYYGNVKYFADIYITNAVFYINGTDARTVSYGAACSDEITALTTGTAKITFRMPHAMTLTAVRASLTTAQASGSIFTVDINESGTSVLSTKLTIDNTELTSTTAATPPVISDSALADDASITVDIDQIGTSGATGLKVWLIGIRLP